MDSKESLAVILDDEPMDPVLARELWSRFSKHMEDNRGDLVGFAQSEGFASVTPALDSGRPVLRVSRSKAQGPYRTAEQAAPSGSLAPQRRGRPDW